ncbi:MAG TPA: molybdopterin-guanine dinucleotide biosynthesis protein B [Acetobacteraceae bacterium]|nr:molybdopterin-guanine dinucleotide biosynthesis protein B [Acetobacteraceae bacterium]
MKVLGIVGWSGSGKTTLLVSVLPLLRARGLIVSTVKHTHHGFDMDRPGKDTYRHREAGAHEVLVASGTRWALLHEIAGPEPGLSELLGRLDQVDIVLVEGFKSHPFPKLEVHRPALAKPPIWPEVPDVVAVASDTDLEVGARTLLPLDRPGIVAAWICNHLALKAANSS